MNAPIATTTKIEPKKIVGDPTCGTIRNGASTPAKSRPNATATRVYLSEQFPTALRGRGQPFGESSDQRSPRDKLAASSIPVGRITARIELLEATAQSGRRYEDSDATAQRLGSQRALRRIRIDLDGCGALPWLDVEEPCGRAQGLVAFDGQGVKSVARNASGA